MVKTPRTRHSKAKSEPVTIELEPGAVSRLSSAADTVAEPTPSEAADIELEKATRAVEDETAAESPQDAAAQQARDESLPHEPTGDFDTEPPHTEPASGSSDYDFTSDTASQPEPPRTSPYTPASQPKRSRLPMFAAGLLGGAVALAGGGLLQFAGLLDTPGGAGSGAPALGAVEAEIAALKTEISTLKDGAGAMAGDVSGRIDALSQALDQTKADVGSLRQAVESGAAGENPGLKALDARIGEIEAAVAGLGQGSDGASPAEIAAINEKVAGVEALAKAAGEAGSAVAGKLGALEQSLSALTAKVDAQAAQPKIALAIASAALKSAIERGMPFPSEIETFAAVAPDVPELAPLRAYAEKGVATRSEILAETDAAAKVIIATSNPPRQDAGFFERLLSSAESLVTVRPIGAVEGPGVPETVARMEVALRSGDLAKAIAEFDTLPEPARTAGAAFGDKIRARLDVERLVDQAIAAAMQAA